MRQDVKLKGKLKGYTQTPLVLTALFGAMDVWMYVLNIKAGVLGSVFVGIYFFVMLFVYWRNKPILMNELIDFATQYGTVQKRLLNEFEVPYAVMDATGKLLWMNRQFEALSEKNKGYHKSITTIFPQITRELMEKEDELELVVEREECVYRASVHKIHFTDILHESSSIELTEKVQYLQVIYLFDETQLTRYRIENQEHDKVLVVLSLFYQTVDGCKKFGHLTVYQCDQQRFLYLFHGIQDFVIIINIYQRRYHLHFLVFNAVPGQLRLIKEIDDL